MHASTHALPLALMLGFARSVMDLQRGSESHLHGLYHLDDELSLVAPRVLV
jgi:hypothetical protein